MEDRPGALAVADPAAALDQAERFDAFGLFLPNVDALVARAAAVGRWLRVTAEGLENVPAEGPALLVTRRSPLHPLETLLIQLMLRGRHPRRRWARPLLEPGLWRWPPGYLLGHYLAGVIAHPSNARYLLAKGELVLVHRRGADDALLSRVEDIALELGAPVVPVVLARRGPTWRGAGTIAFRPPVRTSRSQGRRARRMPSVG